MICTIAIYIYVYIYIYISCMSDLDLFNCKSITPYSENRTDFNRIWSTKCMIIMRCGNQTHAPQLQIAIYIEINIYFINFMVWHSKWRRWCRQTVSVQYAVLFIYSLFIHTNEMNIFCVWFVFFMAVVFVACIYFPHTFWSIDLIL